MELIDAWAAFVADFKTRKELEKKRRQFKSLTDQPLNYQIIEDIARVVSSQRPGFYSILKFKDGNSWELGIRESARQAPARQPDETF